LFLHFLKKRIKFRHEKHELAGGVPHSAKLFGMRESDKIVRPTGRLQLWPVPGLLDVSMLLAFTQAVMSALPISRRQFFAAAGAACAGWVLSRVPTTATSTKDFVMDLIRFKWVRDPHNPIIKPGSGGDYNKTACMSPVVIPRGDEYWLYYTGGDAQDRRRISLAIAHRERPTEFQHIGPILDYGAEDDFDAMWQVCPRVFQVGAKWYMIYTGLPKTGWSKGVGGSIRGLGMAESDDGLKWRKLGINPTLHGNQFPEFPNNPSIGGGGPPIRVQDPDGKWRYRLYCSLPVGRPHKDKRIDQEKLAMVGHSEDGLHWSDFRIIMRRRPELTREDCAANYPVVWRDGDLFRCLYCSIGTRWGAYSIAEAVSRDGYEWYRGGPGDDNLSIAPTGGNAWDGQMTCYPTVVREGDKMRVYFNGNGYGKSGIGTAVAPLPA
jgi:hypothetical protein